MQGRLLPMVDGRIQAFPGEAWPSEFALASDIGFSAIELTIDTASFDDHPVRHSAGQSELTALSHRYGIALAGLCCDVFMDAPLVDADEAVRRHAAGMLDDLIRCGADAGLPMIELPMLGRNSLAKAAAPDAFSSLLDRALTVADDAGVDLLLEADLDPPGFAALMSRHGHSRLGVNYDMGNSTYFRFEPAAEFAAYHARIRNVHVKDCTAADYSVALGTGDTPLAQVFGLLSRYGYRGDFILQAARGADDVATARGYHALVRQLVAASFPNRRADVGAVAE